MLRFFVLLTITAAVLGTIPPSVIDFIPFTSASLTATTTKTVTFTSIFSAAPTVGVVLTGFSIEGITATGVAVGFQIVVGASTTSGV